MDHIRLDGGFHMGPPIAPPPLINQPPQIFGGYTQDGIPIQHLPPEIAAQMFPDTLLDDANEAKRRRIARVSKRHWGPHAPRRLCGGPGGRSGHHRG